MTGATDGDVERALAAMGAAHLKYHSFGVVTPRPSGEQATSPAMFGQQSGQMVGTGGAWAVTSRRAAAVFPLLGDAVPEAFHLDVEPRWPALPASGTVIGSDDLPAALGGVTGLTMPAPNHHRLFRPDRWPRPGRGERAGRWLLFPVHAATLA